MGVRDEDGSADLQHVLDAARTIGLAVNGEKIVITKSTVPVGTATRSPVVSGPSSKEYRPIRASSCREDCLILARVRATAWHGGMKPEAG